jgi:acid phosphatase class B
MPPKKPTKAAIAKAKAAEAKAAKEAAAVEAVAVEAAADEAEVKEVSTSNVTFSVEDQPVVEVGTIDRNEVFDVPPGLNVQKKSEVSHSSADTSSVISSLLNLKTANTNIPLKTADDIVSIVPG